MKETEEWNSWRWVPSPQSRRSTSRSVSSAMALADRSFVGQLPAVPRKVRRIGRRDAVPPITPPPAVLGH
jgi:hypothetical protein